MNPAFCLLRTLQGAVLTALVLGMGILYFILFFMGGYGRGDDVFILLQSYNSFFYSCAITAVGLTLLLALLDVGYWRGPFRLLAALMLASTVVAYMLTALSFTAEFAASPICVYLCLCPLVIYLFKLTPLYSHQPDHVFVFYLAIALGITGVISLAVWLYWLIAEGKWWGEQVKLDFFQRLHCLPASVPIPPANVSQVIKEVEAAGACNAAIVEWISPLLLAVFCILLSISMLFLVRAETLRRRQKKQMDMKAQAFTVLLSLLLLGMWASAGIAGADVNLSTIVFTFCFLFLVIGCSAMVLLSGTKGLQRDMMSVPLARRVLESVHSDWLRALGMIAVIPLSVVALPLSRLRQLGRKYLFFTKRMEDERERALYFSLEATRMLAAVRKWHWTSVLTKMIWWGVAFFSLSVICARVLNVIFSALGERITAMGLTLGPVVGVFTVVAFLIFQLPPVPGMPIFYAAAVIITQSAMQEGWTLWQGWALATVIALLLKYSSLISGQLLGQLMGAYSTKIRSMVGVNSYEMRAIRYILQFKGCNFRKSAMLCGSPDWPAAVICGILRASYVQTIVHQFPVIIIVLPITLSGSLTLVANQNGIYSSAATISLSVAVLCQGLSMMIAMHYIEDTVQYKKEELDKFEADEAVAELDRKALLVTKHRSHVSSWRFLPLTMRAALLSGVFAECLSLYLFLLFSSHCFVAFQVTDSIAVQLDGNALNLVKPLGWLGIATFLYGCVVLILLGRWISCQRKPDASTEQELAVTVKTSKQVGTEQEKDDEEDSVFSPRYSSCLGVCARD